METSGAVQGLQLYSKGSFCMRYRHLQHQLEYPLGLGARSVRT
jgi:hypothetical protein